MINKPRYNIIALLILAIITLALSFVGCQSSQQTTILPSTNLTNATFSTNQNFTSKISTAQTLFLTPQDLVQLGLVTNETNCTVDSYETSVDSPLAQNGMCTYYINNLSGSQIIIQLYKFADPTNINYSFQYNSGHLQGAKGIISLNTFGDQSRFSKNSPDDYGAEFNKDNTSYYHLWFTKDLYMVHVTSKGVPTDGDYVQNISRLILSKFE